MIFVTIGTHELGFKRLLDYLEKMEIEEEVIIQSGHTDFVSEKYTVIPFLSQEKFNEYMKKSNLIITHGGVGSILGALKKKKKVLAVPRLAKYREHNDDHQLEICEKLEEDNYLTVCRNYDELEDGIFRYKNKVYKEYMFDNRKLLSFIEEEIG